MNLEIILNTIFYSIFLMKVIETIQINAPDSDLEQLSVFRICMWVYF